MAADGFIPSTALILAKPSRPITTLLTSFFAEDFFRVDINKSYHEPRRFAKTTAPDGQITSPNQKRVKPLRVKYLSSVLQKYVIISPHPASTRRGVSRSSRTLERDAVDEKMLSAPSARRRRHLFGRPSRVVLSPRRWGQALRDDVREVTGANKPGAPRRARSSR